MVCGLEQILNATVSQKNLKFPEKAPQILQQKPNEVRNKESVRSSRSFLRNKILYYSY